MATARLLVEQAELAVGDRRGLLDAGERDDELGIDRDRRAGDREILQRAQGMDAVVGVGGHGAVAEEVVLDPHRLGNGLLLWRTIRQSNKRQADSGTIIGFGGSAMDELDFSKPAQPKPRRRRTRPRRAGAQARSTTRHRARLLPRRRQARGAPPPAPSSSSENEQARIPQARQDVPAHRGPGRPGAKGKPIGIVKAGEIFGEMAAISESPRSAAAVAQTECRVIRSTTRSSQRRSPIKPEFALMLMSMMILRLRGMLARLAQNNTLSGDDRSSQSRVFDKDMVAALAKGLGHNAMSRHNAGASIFKEGAAGALVYVVLEGRIAVSIKGKSCSASGRAASSASWRSSTRRRARRAPTAETDCALVSLNRAVFRQSRQGESRIRRGASSARSPSACASLPPA